MRELLSEIWSSIRKNKLRTFLTGFSVAWGILMLIILLGSGSGLQNGIYSNFEFMAKNTVEVYRGYTTIPYGGYDKGRLVRFYNSDMEMLAREFPEIDMVTSSTRYSMSKITYGKNFLNVSMSGVSPDYLDMVYLELLAGRFINQQDIDERRKVVVIEEGMQSILFGEESPIGKQIIERNIAYTVVGVYRMHKYGNQHSCFIPYTTGQSIYLQGDPRIGYIMFTTKGITTEAQMDRLENEVRARLAAERNFSPKDKNAVYIWSTFRQFKQFEVITGGINAIIWIIGLGTLLAGIVGVSNIMLVTVRERTFEFGIRKTLGAKPSSIITLILLESVLITIIFGYCGMILGVGIMEIVNYFVESAAAADTGSVTMFLNPTLDLGAAIAATVVLVLAGLVAGYVPAKRAARLKTIDALRYNK